MKQNYLVIAVVGLVLVTGAFFGGMKYQQLRTGNRVANLMQANGGLPGGRGGRTDLNGQNGQGMMRFGGQGVRPVNGEIVSVDDKSVTVKLPDGSSKIVMLSSTAVINKSSTGSKDDLKAGERVMIFGTENSDGSVTAQNIQLNPAMMGTTSAQPSASPVPTKK